MIRNSILYRRLWYVKKRNTRKINLLLRLSIAAIIMYFIISVYQSKILSTVIEAWLELGF